MIFFIGAFLCQIDNFKWNSQEDFKTIIHNSWDQRIWIVPRNCCAAVFSLNWQSMGSFLLSSIIALYLIHQGVAGIRFLIFVFTNFFIVNFIFFSRIFYTKIVIFYTEILTGKVVLWCFFSSETNEKIHNSTFQVKISV